MSLVCLNTTEKCYIERFNSLRTLRNCRHHAGVDTDLQSMWGLHMTIGKVYSNL